MSAEPLATSVAETVARFADVRVWVVAHDSLAPVEAPTWVRAAAAGGRWDGSPAVSEGDRFHLIACIEQAIRRGRAEAEIQLDEPDERVLVVALDLRPEDDLVVVLAGIEIEAATERRHGGIDATTGLLDRQGLVDRLHALPGDRPAVLVLARAQGLGETVRSADGVDQVVAAIAARVRERLAESGWLARVGFDTFALLTTDETAVGEDEQLVQRLADAVRQPVRASDGAVEFSAALGWARGDVGDSLLTDAEVALHEADTAAGGSVRYSERLRERVSRQSRLRHDLPSALARDELFLDFQPIHDLHELRPVGAEALMRWQHPDFGLLRPARFIPLAEESGVIADLGWWLADQAVRALVALRSTFASTTNFFVAINVSGRQLNDDRLARDLERVLELHGVDPASLVVELTETALLAGDDGVEALLRVADLGCRLAIDDFGAGFASLDYLSRLPVAWVKLHPSFIRRIDEPRVATLVPAILELCRTLGVDVSAEGIESSRQLRRIRDLGVGTGQGYVLGRPAALDSLIGEEAAAGVARPRSGPAVLVP
ncbi:MAG: GGDEF domain-containing phosphodiesterase [Acidimicrobiia bacterium]|nr:GGDEF domain-containing phosphodiesterase [Acidimicrobiia bacterium]